MLSEFKMIGAGTATISLGGVATGVGFIFGNLLTAMSKNPSLSQVLFRYAILGFALTEAMGLFALMLIFLILF